MAGGNDDAAAAAQFPDRIREHGRGGQPVIKPGMDALFRKRHGADLGKQPGIVPGIVADGGDLRQVRAGKPRSHALGRPADGVEIQPVAACTHNAPHTGGAELQFASEAAFQFFFVALQGIQFPVHALRQTCVPPESIALHVVHVHSSVYFEMTARDSPGFPVLSLQIYA